MSEVINEIQSNLLVFLIILFTAFLAGAASARGLVKGGLIPIRVEGPCRALVMLFVVYGLINLFVLS